MKQSLIISNEQIYTICLTSCQTTQKNLKTSCRYCLVPSPLPKNEHFINTRKNLPKNRNWIFPAVRYFTWNLELVSSILWMTVDPLRIRKAWNILTLRIDRTTLSICALIRHFFVDFLFHQKSCAFVIFISFFDELSNFRNRILTNQTPKLVVRT